MSNHIKEGGTANIMGPRPRPTLWTPCSKCNHKHTNVFLCSNCWEDFLRSEPWTGPNTLGDGASTEDRVKAWVAAQPAASPTTSSPVLSHTEVSMVGDALVNGLKKIVREHQQLAESCRIHMERRQRDVNNIQKLEADLQNVRDCLRTSENEREKLEANLAASAAVQQKLYEDNHKLRDPVAVRLQREAHDKAQAHERADAASQIAELRRSCLSEQAARKDDLAAFSRAMESLHKHFELANLENDQRTVRLQDARDHAQQQCRQAEQQLAQHRVMIKRLRRQLATLTPPNLPGSPNAVKAAKAAVTRAARRKATSRKAGK